MKELIDLFLPLLVSFILRLTLFLLLHFFDFVVKDKLLTFLMLCCIMLFIGAMLKLEFVHDKHIVSE